MTLPEMATRPGRSRRFAAPVETVRGSYPNTEVKRSELHNPFVRSSCCVCLEKDLEGEIQGGIIDHHF